jgi:predicted RNase H-like nuclease (RuvC/YqgF family)
MAPQSPESRLARIEEMSARLDERTASLIREVERLARDVETTAVESGQVIEVLAEVRAVTEDFNKLRAELDAERERERLALEQELKDLRTERKMSPALKVALISAGGAIVVAIIAAVSGHS